MFHFFNSAGKKKGLSAVKTWCCLKAAQQSAQVVTVRDRQTDRKKEREVFPVFEHSRKDSTST